MQVALITKQVPLESPALRRAIIWAAFLFLLLVMAQTVRGAFWAAEIRHGWVIGDWLVNYQGGFVRRGLIGEGIFRLAALLAVNPDRVVISLQSLSYGTFIWFSFLLLRRQKEIWRYVLLIISPAIFLFQIYVPSGGYRKEILFLALLAFTVWAAKSLSTARFERLFFGLLLLFPALVLSHETMAIWLPLLLIVYVSQVPLTRKRVAIVLALCSFSVLALAASLLNRGDATVAAKIAFSLREAGYMNLKAAIASLASTPAQGFEFTKTYIEKGNYFINYPLALLLAGLAFVPVRARLAAIFTPITTFLFCVSLVGTAFVLVVAADWGRFLDVLVVSLFLLSFLPPEKPAPFKAALWLVVLFVPTLFSYASFWHFPHSGKANPFNAALFQPYR